jgi:acyl carrier protein
VSVGFDALGAVRGAVAIVCEVAPDSLADSTRFEDLGADSLARVSIADLVEADAASSGNELHIDDASLCRMTSLGELADYATAHLVDHSVLRVAS